MERLRGEAEPCCPPTGIEGLSLTFLKFADVLGQPVTFGFYAGLVFVWLIECCDLPCTRDKKKRKVKGNR